MERPQVADRVYMVRPTSFGFNAQAAKTNHYMNQPAAEAADIRDAAINEFDQMVDNLWRHDIDVTVWDDEPEQPLPDAVYPNNWLAVWPQAVFLYPMAPATRRGERRPEIVDHIIGYGDQTIIDLSHHEQQGRFLEGTGAMVFDHDNRLVYGALSPRCDKQLFEQHAHELGYQPISFDTNHRGGPVYHTNVLLAVQPTTAVVCADVIANPMQRQLVLDTLVQTGHDIVQITPDQMARFCANILPVQARDGRQYLVMSRSAYNAFSPEQRLVLSGAMSLLHSPLRIIEHIGGGSARCMLAELALTPVAASVAEKSAVALP